PLLQPIRPQQQDIHRNVAGPGSPQCMHAERRQEVKPFFNVTFDDKAHAIDFSSKDAFITSIDQLYTKLPADMKSEVQSAVKARTSWLQHCENNPFTADTCKLGVPELIKDEWSGQKWPKHY